MKKEKINLLVTGSRGQLGSELRDISTSWPDFSFHFVDVEDLDLTKRDAVAGFFKTHPIDAVVNCAAYTAVDLAEDQQDLAYLVNAEAVKTLAELCSERKIRMIHISTDYVFDGESNQPIDENERPNPVSIYGESKLKGEEYLTSILPDAYIIRTAWVYSVHGKNFVKTIANLARQRDELSVVSDQIGTPTYAYDLAGAIMKMLNAIFNANKDVPGIYHYTNEGVISWYDFAHFIIRHYDLQCKLKPIRTSEYKTKATRPKFSLLSKRKIAETFGITPPHWHDSLTKCLEKLDKQG